MELRGAVAFLLLVALAPLRTRSQTQASARWPTEVFRNALGDGQAIKDGLDIIMPHGVTEEASLLQLLRKENPQGTPQMVHMLQADVTVDANYVPVMAAPPGSKQMTLDTWLDWVSGDSKALEHFEDWKKYEHMKGAKLDFKELTSLNRSLETVRKYDRATVLQPQAAGYSVPIWLGSAVIRGPNTPSSEEPRDPETFVEFVNDEGTGFPQCTLALGWTTGAAQGVESYTWRHVIDMLHRAVRRARPAQNIVFPLRISLLGRSLEWVTWLQERSAATFAVAVWHGAGDEVEAADKRALNTLRAVLPRDRLYFDLEPRALADVRSWLRDKNIGNETLATWEGRDQWTSRVAEPNLWSSPVDHRLYLTDTAAVLVGGAHLYVQSKEPFQPGIVRLQGRVVFAPYDNPASEALPEARALVCARQKKLNVDERPPEGSLGGVCLSVGRRSGRVSLYAPGLADNKTIADTSDNCFDFTLEDAGGNEEVVAVVKSCVRSSAGTQVTVRLRAPYPAHGAFHLTLARDPWTLPPAHPRASQPWTLMDADVIYQQVNISRSEAENGAPSLKQSNLLTIQMLSSLFVISITFSNLL